MEPARVSSNAHHLVVDREVQAAVFLLAFLLQLVRVRRRVELRQVVPKRIAGGRARVDADEAAEGAALAHRVAELAAQIDGVSTPQVVSGLEYQTNQFLLLAANEMRVRGG